MKKQLPILSLLLILFSPIVFAQTSHTVTMDADSFIPADLTINEGDEVIWSNTSSVVHTSTSGSHECVSDGIWNSGDIAAGATFSRTFPEAGTFTYYCIYHCGIGMVGTITVQSVTGTKKKTASSSLKINNLFPNPADNQTTLEYTVLKPGEVQVEIVNEVGTVVKSYNANHSAGKNTINLDLSDLPTGMYFCTLMSNSERVGTMISIQ